MIKSLTNIQWETEEHLIILDTWFKKKSFSSFEHLIKEIELKLVQLKAYCAYFSKTLDTKNVELIKLAFNEITTISHGHKIKNSSNLLNLFHRFRNDPEELSNFIEILYEDISMNIYSVPVEHEETLFYEGDKQAKLHIHTERDPRIVKAKKNQFKAMHNALYCEACYFNFENCYGLRGVNYAQVHHLKPLSELDSKSLIHLNDLAILCSNCHSMIHRKKPWLSLESLKKIIQHIPEAQSS